MRVAILMIMLILFGVLGHCADKWPISPLELRKTEEPLKAQAQEAEQQLQEQERRLRELEEEMKSPDQKRSLEQIREEIQAILKERTLQQKQLQEAMKQHDRALIEAVKSRSVVITGTASACGVLEQLYPEFMGAQEPKRAASFSPQLYYEASGNEAGFQKLIAGKTEAAVLDRPLNKQEKAALESKRPR